ncbi:MAG TPA: NUDIX hydrolase [Methanobacterium subterraneum]|uniref:NUDIX hydrolase n=1 Tax=Methanobacterium subterraneum TaxID=59277 RepID=A0A7J4TK45_9EURY|nr:NUDIX hydrolase [Methanobacterium subterraneum]
MTRYKHPLLTVDAVINTIKGKIIFIKRKNSPYKGSWALPGGFVEYGETVEEAVIREVKEETGAKIEIQDLLGVYSDPARDPRGHLVTICFLAIKTEGMLKADTDATEVACFTVNEAMEMNLAFDHNKILKDAIKRIS